MSTCTPAEFKRRRVKEALETINNKNAITYKVKGNALIITPSNKSNKIRTRDQAVKAAQGMLKKLTKVYGKKYMFNVYGHWGTMYNTPEGAAVEINIPTNLVKAVQKEQQGPTLFDMAMNRRKRQDDLDSEPLDFIRYLTFKESLLRRAQKALQNAFASQKYSPSKKWGRKIDELKEMVDYLESDIKALKKEDVVLDNVFKFLEYDVGIIENLIASGSVENMHTAERMIEFLKTVGDYSKKNRKTNPILNDSYDVAPDVKEYMDSMNIALGDASEALYDAKRKYLTKLISTSPQVQNMYPGLELDDMIQDMPDIDILSKLFLTTDKQVMSEDSLIAQLVKIELEEKRNFSKGFAAGMKDRLNKAVDNAKNKLPKVGNIFGYIETDYSIFYQTDAKGNKTPRIVSRYSGRWFKNDKELIKDLKKEIIDIIFSQQNSLNAALQGRDVNDIRDELYDNLKQHTEILNIRNIPEVLEHPLYSSYIKDPNLQEAEDYKRKIIAKIGEVHYKEIVDNQLSELTNYEHWKDNRTDDFLSKNGVRHVNELSDNQLKVLAEFILRSSPYEFSESHHSGRGNIVSINPGSNPLKSNISYNTYFPKTEIAHANINNPLEPLNLDSRYYDESFKTIEADDDLYKLWEMLIEGTEFINSTIADAENKVVHGSILSMHKSWLDIIVDPNLGFVNKFTLLTKDTIRGLLKHFASKTGKRSPENQDDISKHQFKTVEKEAELISRRIKLEIEEKMGDKILTTPMAVLNIPMEVMDMLSTEFGLPKSRHKLLNIFKKPSILLNTIIDEYSLNKIVEEQTFNLPVILRAYIEMAAEYKAQMDSQPMITLYRDAYKDIKKTEDEGILSNMLSRTRQFVFRNMDKDKDNSKRKRANERLDYFYSRNILSSSNQDKSAPLPTINLEAIKPGLKIEWKVWNKYEKDLAKALKKKIKEPGLSDQEIINLQAELDQLGYNVTASAIYNALFNELGIFVGLAFSVKANVINRFQGIFQTMFHDTGRFATEGNFTKATHFITHKGLRYVPGFGEYKKQVKIARLVINRLNVLQDATNEIDRARNESGLTGLAKKVSPFYITEYTEWHNQSPQILGLLMDMEIKDKNGVAYPVFDGKAFSAYEIDEKGLLTLNEDFMTPENAATWLQFSDQESSNNKLIISEVISIVNGDYSRTGGVLFKKNVFGRTLMLFKTWLSNNVWVRFAPEHDNLILGKTQKGVYASHRPITLGITAAAIGMLSAGIATAGVMGAVGLGVGYAVSKRNDRELVSLSHAVREMSFIALEILNKMRGIPQGLVTGKAVGSVLDNLDLEENDLQRLKSICNEIAMILSTMLVYVMINAIQGGDDDEPKTLDGQKLDAEGSNANPYYPGNVKSSAKKKLLTALENQFARLIEDVTLYIDPMTFVNNVVIQNRLTMVLQQVSAMPAVINKFNNGLDEITMGPDAGKSRLIKNLSQFVLPALIRHPLSLGFKSLVTRDFKTDYFDTFFDSDYKSDRRIVKAMRAGDRAELTKIYREMLDYDDLTAKEQVVTDDYIKAQVDIDTDLRLPYPPRDVYDAEQKRTKMAEEHLDYLKKAKKIMPEIPEE